MCSEFNFNGPIALEATLLNLLSLRIDNREMPLLCPGVILRTITASFISPKMLLPMLQIQVTRNLAITSHIVVFPCISVEKCGKTKHCT